MRVALLSYNAQAGDAIGNQVAEKLAFFLERGADVRVFVQSDKRLNPAIHSYVQCLNGPEPAGPCWEFLSTADLIVVEYGQYYPLLSLLPLLVGGKPRIVFDYHGITPAEWWGAHNREALEEGARQRGLVWAADAALAHSRFTKRELQQNTRFPDAWLRVLGHPLDTKRFCPGRARLSLRQELGLETASLLLFVGRLAPNKRVPLLVDALARLRDLSPAVHAVIVGDTGDLYEAERHRCQARAAEIGVAERLHFLGHVRDDRLVDAYRSADVFVMPSLHEGFCIPLIEAMACGVPVVAARAGALPETVAGAGLTFTADNAEDLARQIRRVLAPGRSQPAKLPSSLRVALVTFRWGTDFVGGAETSLRTIAGTLKSAGHEVEVFTTCTNSESIWANRLPEGSFQLDGISVHRFRLDPHDRAKHLDAVRSILSADGAVSEEVELQYLRHSIHSTRLLEALGRRLNEFDAVLAGPYLFGLTFDVAQAFPEKTILVPCFHDEPFARLRLWRTAYPYVGGILYHSSEEREFAEVELGLNHPGAVCLGTVIDVETRGHAERGRTCIGGGRPYLVYCGRYSPQKNLPLLLEDARRYQALHPGRFTFAFLGQGEVPIPRESWAHDLGFVDEASKHDILAGAAALVHLSRYESLSLVALEAWAQGTPVIADGGCKVLAGHLSRSGAGKAVDSFETFAAVLDDLWQRPEHWQTLGQQGRNYVRTHFGCRSTFSQLLESACRDLAVPLGERMRRQGLLRAAELDRDKWRERFGRLIEEVLDSPSRPFREQVVVRPRSPSRTVAAGQDTVLVPVRVANQGTHVIAHKGPARFCLRCLVHDEAGQPCAVDSLETSLPGLLLPGQELAAAMRVPVPAAPGFYRVGLRAERVDRESPHFQSPAESWLQLVVEGRCGSRDHRCCDESLEAIQAALVRAAAKQSLPDDYTDVTEGFLASWKRRLKRKLLGNFKHAYVDVLSRQQSAFNRYLLTALQEVAECCALLDHARRTGEGGKIAVTDGPVFLASAIENAVTAGGAEDLAVLLHKLLEELAQSRKHSAALEERLTRLETRIAERSKRQS